MDSDKSTGFGAGAHFLFHSSDSAEEVCTLPQYKVLNSGLWSGRMQTLNFRLELLRVPPKYQCQTYLYQNGTVRECHWDMEGGGSH